MSLEKERLAHLGDVALAVSCELGRRQLELAEVRRLEVGSVIKLVKVAGESSQVLINGQPFAEGETVVLGETICMRVTGMVDSPQEVRA